MARRIDLKDQAPEPVPPKHTPAVRFALFADSGTPVRGVTCDDTSDTFRQALKLSEDERDLHNNWHGFEMTGENLDLALAPYHRWLEANPSHRWADLDEVENSGTSSTIYRAHLAGVSSQHHVPLVAIRGYPSNASSAMDVGVLQIGVELIPFHQFQRRYGPVSKIEQTVWLPLNKDRQSSVTKETLALDVIDFHPAIVPINFNVTGLGVIGGAVLEERDISQWANGGDIDEG